MTNTPKLMIDPDTKHVVEVSHEVAALNRATFVIRDELRHQLNSIEHSLESINATLRVIEEGLSAHFSFYVRTKL